MKALYHAMKNIDDETIVLKSRTDKVWLHFNPEEMIYKFLNAAPTGPLSPYRHRVQVMAMLPLQPFFINDILFMGLGADIRKMISFDMWFELEQALVNAEQIFHYYPHSNKNDIFRQFYSINPGLIHKDCTKARSVQKSLLQNEIFLRATSGYLNAFEQGYILGMVHNGDFKKPAADNLYDLLDMNVENNSGGIRFVNGANTLEIVKNEAVSFLLDIPISSTNRQTLRSFSNFSPLSTNEYKLYFKDAVNALQLESVIHASSPQLSYYDGGCKIVPSRTRYIFPE
jgi:hypothetical protein